MNTNLITQLSHYVNKVIEQFNYNCNVIIKINVKLKKKKVTDVMKLRLEYHDFVARHPEYNNK